MLLLRNATATSSSQRVAGNGMIQLIPLEAAFLALVLSAAVPFRSETLAAAMAVQAPVALALEGSTPSAALAQAAPLALMDPWVGL